jgi:hypothetical protein
MKAKRKKSWRRIGGGNGEKRSMYGIEERYRKKISSWRHGMASAMKAAINGGKYHVAAGVVMAAWRIINAKENEMKNGGGNGNGGGVNS